MSTFDTIGLVLISVLCIGFLIWSIRNLLLTPEERRRKIEKIQKDIEERRRRMFEQIGTEIQGEPSHVDENKPHRYISSSVRREVWRRDQGRCVSCGSKENLEFDHIIPVSKGGSNTPRNIELLCEKCNRTKSNKVE